MNEKVWSTGTHCCSWSDDLCQAGNTIKSFSALGHKNGRNAFFINDYEDDASQSNISNCRGALILQQMTTFINRKMCELGNVCL